jgi:predicted Zn finger-like uncharacterized protein
MIVTCASCLTKFNLEDSKIPARGAKVRCSRCKHVFFVPPPGPAQEEIVENFESFAKRHEDVVGRPEKKKEPALPPLGEEEEEGEFPSFEEEEKSLFAEEQPPRLEERVEVRAQREEVRPRAKTFKPEKRVRKEKKGPSIFLALFIIIFLLAIGGFYLWTELESGGKLAPYIEPPLKKITTLWQQIWGTEKEGLVPRIITQYHETLGDVRLLVFEGQVTNESKVAKKHVKVRVSLLDQNKARVAEKEVLCGRTIRKDELVNLPTAFFQGDVSLNPGTETEMVLQAGKSIPFVLIFKDLPSQVTQYNVEIIEAPNLK